MLKQISKPANGHLAEHTFQDAEWSSETDSDAEVYEMNKKMVSVSNCIFMASKSSGHTDGRGSKGSKQSWCSDVEEKLAKYVNTAVYYQ